MTINRCILLSCLATVLLANTSCFSKKITSKPATIAATKDSDLDGVYDTDDKCPDIKGLAKLDGCPDTDGDGIADYQDKCPEAIGQARYQGCPVPDTDKDGINDDADECPTVFGYARYQGCQIPDTDGDGVNEEEDKCPQEAGPASNKGCPLLGSVKNRVKPGKKNDTLLLKNGAASRKAGNGLANNKSAAVNRSSTPTSGDPATSPAVNPGISDSIPTTANPDSASRSATLRFSFPNTIAARETKNLSIELIINEISGEAAEQTVPVFLQKNDSTTSVSLPVIATYKKLSLSFLYDKQLIQITPSVPEAQEPDLTKGNSWHWKMEALKITSGVDTITLQVNGETAEGLKLTVAQQQVNIKIVPGAPVSFWSGAGKWIVSIGLIALSAIFFFLFVARSKKKKAAAGQNS